MSYTRAIVAARHFIDDFAQFLIVFGKIDGYRYILRSEGLLQVEDVL